MRGNSFGLDTFRSKVFYFLKNSLLLQDVNLTLLSMCRDLYGIFGALTYEI